MRKITRRSDRSGGPAKRFSKPRGSRTRHADPEGGKGEFKRKTKDKHPTFKSGASGFRKDRPGPSAGGDKPFRGRTPSRGYGKARPGPGRNREYGARKEGEPWESGSGRERRQEDRGATDDRKFSPRRKEAATGERPAYKKRFDAGKSDYHDKKSGPRRYTTPKREDSPEGGDRRRWNRREDHSFYGDRRKSPNKPKVDKPVDDGSSRLNKYIANAGICSRREADEMIAAGVITVNGEVITKMGYKVMPGDEVRYNGEQLRSEKMVYLLVNKPKDFITTADDPGNRKTVMSLIEDACRERVYPVGRLDRNTTGLLLFTNDGELARRLTHPSFEVQKIYQVDLDKNLKPADMDQIAAGIQLEDGLVRPDAISYVGSGSDKSVVGIELHSGKNRIVRRIFESLDYKVKKLDRVYFAGLSKKDLPRGRWRFLTEMEVASLKMLTGDKRFKSLPPQDKYVAID